ncbi:MAG: response regulator [Rubrivivax sp.]|nr:MAG: response regulator [Rubrivivax sp.]
MTQEAASDTSEDSSTQQLKLLRAVLDSSSSFMHVLRGPTFIVEYANAAYFRLVGQRDLIGRPAFEAMPEAAEGGFQERIAEVMRTGQPFIGRELPVMLARSEGRQPELRLVDLVYLRLDAASPDSARVVGHGTDVTEHVMALREAEKLERETHQRLADALTTAKMAAWEWDPQTARLTYSDWMPQLYRLGADEPRATPFDWQQALHPDHRDAHARMVREAARKTGSWHTEFRLRGDDEVWLEERAHAITDEESGARRIVGLAWDISERKKLEMRLRQSVERKSNFLATLAHELRNPLAPIRNGLELLKRADLPPARGQAVRDMMARQLTHLVRLVDDLMEVSRITHGKVELRKERLLLGSVLTAAIETAWPRIEEKGLRLETQFEGMYPLEADRDRLAQVFSNLLSNAAKFTSPGGTIRVSAKAQGSEVTVCVSDTGCGIAPDHLEAIFEMFSQGPTHHTAGGLGIGLALVRQLVTLHGGTVHASSEGAGQGSVFTVRLPLSGATAAAHEPAAEAVPNAAQPARVREVLVVDDNVDAADSLADAIRARGHAVRTAYGGAAALEACTQRLPEVLVLDIGMPGMDGYEVARRVGSRWRASERPCLAALTGWGQPEDKQRAMEAGFDRHFTKPVDFEELLSELAL